MNNEKPLPPLSGLLSVLQSYLNEHGRDYRNLNEDDFKTLRRIASSANETHQQLSYCLDVLGQVFWWALENPKEENPPIENLGDFGLVVQMLGRCMWELTEIEATAETPARLLAEDKARKVVPISS